MVQESVSGGNLATGRQTVLRQASALHLNVSAASMLIVAISMWCLDARAQDPSALFSEKCAGCHSIGGGNLVGPDLAPTAEWETGDLAKAVKRMEENTGPLTSAEVDALVEYLKKETPKASATAPLPLPPGAPLPSRVSSKPQTSISSAIELKGKQPELASAERGRRLFFGDEAFKNGGLSCIACHSVDNSGGTMAPDLTGIAQKMPAAALVSAIEKTPYKVMKAAYKEHPIVHQEALDLQAYLSSLKEAHEKPKKQPVALIGSVLAMAVMATIAIGYRGRKTSARSKLKRKD